MRSLAARYKVTWSRLLVVVICVMGLGISTLMLHIVPHLWRVPVISGFDHVLRISYACLAGFVLLRAFIVLWMNSDEELAHRLGETVLWLITTAAILLFTILMCASLIVTGLVDVLRRLRTERNVDALTGILNRRAFRESSELLLSNRQRQSYAVLLCDLDAFKSVNDHYGHAVGDEVLRQFSAVLTESTRQHDLIARIGGEEFVVFLQNTDMPMAMQVVSRIGEHMAEMVV